MAIPFKIEIDNISQGGLAPKYYESTYPSFGNKTQAGKMLNCDLTNAGYIQQGQGLATLTNGTQAGAVTTLMKGILDYAVTSDLTYGIGGARLYSFSSTTVTSGATFPHTIDKAIVTGEDGEDVALYLGNLYYSYNHSGTVGDFGKYDLATTFDDDFGSAGVAGGGAHALEGGVPHQFASTVNQLLYISNGKYIAEYNGVTDILTYNKLDFPTGWVIQSIKWVNNRLWIAVNKTSLTGSNKNRASLFAWDGTTDNPESEIELSGTVGGLYVKNSILYVFYQDVTNTGGYKLAYVNGSQITDICNFTGTLPAFYQVSEYKDFIIWSADGLIHAWGSGDKDLPTRFFQMADGGFSTVGGVSCPFGTPIIASNETTSYKLAKFSGYDVNSYWKSLVFDITSTGKLSQVDSVRVNFDILESGARVDLTLVNNQGKTIFTDQISYAKQGAITTYYTPLNGKIQENFRCELSYANGGTSTTVKIKNVRIAGSIS